MHALRLHVQITRKDALSRNISKVLVVASVADTGGLCLEPLTGIFFLTSITPRLTCDLPQRHFDIMPQMQETHRGDDFNFIPVRSAYWQSWRMERAQSGP